MPAIVFAVCMLVFIGAIVGLVAHCLTPKKKADFKAEYDQTVNALTNRLGRKIVEAKILGAGSTDFRSFGGAVVGGLVAGPIGAVIGGTQGGKGKQKVRFAVKYDDGSVEIKEVRVNSREYNELMKYVSWEDI